MLVAPGLQDRPKAKTSKQCTTDWRRGVLCCKRTNYLKNIKSMGIKKKKIILLYSRWLQHRSAASKTQKLSKDS